jgi:hypothetical protein
VFFLCSAATAILAKLTYVYAFINIATTIATIICFAAVPNEHVSARTAFADFENLSTWNPGTSFLLAFTAPSTSDAPPNQGFYCLGENEWADECASCHPQCGP